MKLYFEPSVLVKVFKSETDSNRMVEILSKIDEDKGSIAYISSWSFLEIARGLKKDRKPKELIELDLRELRNHRIKYKPINREILADAERIIVEHNVYASDSVHAATYRNIERTLKLDAFLTDDKHFGRLIGLVKSRTIRDILL